MEAIESLAGMVSSMLDFPLVGFLGRLVPAGGSEAGQQVSLRGHPVDEFLRTIWPRTIAPATQAAKIEV